MKNTGLKKFASAVMAVAMLVTPLVARAGYAPERQTYTYGPNFKGADHVQFNSIVNNPGFGDERTFFHGRDNAVTSGGWSDPVNNVQPNKEYLLRIFVHNNANQGLNASGKGVAKDTKVKVTLPTQTGTNLVATAAISASNANPGTVTDTLNFKSSTGVKLTYVPGSAELDTAFGKGVKLSDSIVTTGAPIGSEKINGLWPGCFAHAGFVYLKVKTSAQPPVVEKPSLTIAKTVAKGEVAGSGMVASVKPGDKVAYGITVTNPSKADATNVVVRDVMPAGITITGATMAINGGAAQPLADYQKLFTAQGLNIGTVKAGKNAVIVLKGTVKSDATGKECSITLRNTAYVSATGLPARSANATVVVNKDCKQTPVTPGTEPTTPTTETLPEAGAEGAAAAALGLTAMGTTARGYLRSKRGLRNAVRKINR